MMVACVTAGSALKRSIVCGVPGVPGMSNVIVMVPTPLAAFASRMACRSEPRPLSLVLVTTAVVISTGNAGEDCALVRLSPSVSVAVKVCAPSLNVAVVVMSNVPSGRTEAVPTTVLASLSA